MKRKTTYITITLLILLISASTYVFADSSTLELQINNVTMGPDNFGFGLAPVGTDFKYYKYFKFNEALQHEAYFNTYTSFAFQNNAYYGNHDYKTGKPNWISQFNDIKSNPNYISGYYFTPSAYSNIHLEQGFWTNPVNQKTELLTLEFNFETRYAKALEAIRVYEGAWNPRFIEIDNTTGEISYRTPFEPNGHIQAYPWLQDTRTSWTNNFSLGLTLDFSKIVGYGIRDGMIIDLIGEFGPKWLFNTFSMNSPTSNYYELEFSISEYLPLYQKTQDNGFNWLSLQLVHSNSLSRTSGDIVPYHKLPKDRLENTFEDAWYFQLFGPHFIAWDCITDIRLGIYNYCYFGGVVNEYPHETKAFEWKSDITLYFHMRLFGFMHFQYRVSYDIMTGIHTDFPEWFQQAKVRFYISL